jgi:hypothetical protein
MGYVHSYSHGTKLIGDIVCFGMAILAVVISLAKLHRMEIIKHTEANENLEPRTSLAIEMDHMPSGERRERKEGSIAASSV